MRQLEGRLGLVDRCVVDDDIGHPEGVDNRAEGALDAGAVSHVSLGTTRVHPEPVELGQARVDHNLAQGHERNRPALLCEPPCKRRAEPWSRTNDRKRFRVFHVSHLGIQESRTR